MALLSLSGRTLCSLSSCRISVPRDNDDGDDDSFTHLPFVCSPSAPSIFDNKRQDPTGLTALLQSTELVGVVHTLYCILLHSLVPESTSQSQEPYGPGVIQVALQGIRFLNSFALLDLSAFQVSQAMKPPPPPSTELLLLSLFTRQTPSNKLL